MMDHNKYDKEWSSSDYLPRGFAEWLRDIVRENEVKERKAFKQIGVELGVNPSNLSRWIVGKGPLNQNDINNLASKLGPVVYNFLLLPHPVMEKSITEDTT